MTYVAIVALAISVAGCSAFTRPNVQEMTEHCANVCHGQVQTLVLSGDAPTCVCK